jgi:hypothetical protein
MGHFGGDIRSFLINNIYSYRYVCDEKALKLICQSNKEEDEILLEQGIYVDKMTASENIIEIAITAIDKKKPIIVGTDCYYLKDRKSEYNKIHLPHDLLVYGYNLKNEYFHVIEHNHRESYKFYKTTIAFSVIKEAYEGYIQILPYASHPTHYIYYKDHEPQKQSDEYYKNVYSKILIENKSCIFGGLSEINEFGRRLHYTFECLMISKELEQIIDCLNIICNIKSVEKYSLHYIFGDYINNEMLDIVIYNWRFIRNVFVKHNYSNKISYTSLENIILKLKQLYDDEKQYYEYLFNRMNMYQTENLMMLNTGV